MEIIAYITVNLLLFSSWYILLFRSKNSLSFVDRALGTLVLSLAQIILTEMALGVLFKELYAIPLFVFNISVSLGVLILSARMKEPASLESDRTNPDTDTYCKRNSLMPCILRGIFKELRDKTTHFLNVIIADWILLIIFILFLIAFCYMVFIGYLFPSYTWDALLYHLPTVGFILQSGAIEQIPYNSLIYTFINIFPKNMDLFFLWNIIFLKSDVIVDLSQLVFTLSGMLAVYSMAVKLNIKKNYAIYSSLLFFFAPIIILQSTANYVDIAVSVLFLISVNFVMHNGQEEPSLTNDNPSHLRGGTSGTGTIPIPPRRWALVLAGLTAGILLGSKGSGPLFITALSMLYIINELRIRFSLKRKGVSYEIERKLGIKKIITGYSAYFLIPVILLGNYWYLINWVNYHNPVYPFIVKLFGRTVFPGILTELLHSGPDILKNMSPVKKLFYVWLERADHYYYASDVSGFGPLWFIVLMPCAVFSIFLSLWKKKFDFLLVAVMIIIIFLIHPNNWFTRYTIFLYGLGCLAFGFVIQFFQRRGRILTYFVLPLVIYTFLTANTPTVTPGKIQEFVNLPVWKRNLSNLEPFVLNVTQTENYALWDWISRNVSEGDTLAYTFTPTLIAPLWNSSFSNKIVYIKSGGFNEWIKALEINNVDYVMILGKPRSMEYWWVTKLWELRNEPEWSDIYNRFRLEYSDEKYAVMRFVK